MDFDLILIIGDTVFILDYKPELTPKTSKSRMYDNFINSILQVATYGLSAKELFNLKKVYCGTFNKESIWVYDAKAVLEKINAFMNENGDDPF